MKSYLVKRLLTLPPALVPGSRTMDVSPGDVFTVDDAAFEQASRYLRNRITMGDIEQKLEAVAADTRGVK